MRVDQILVILDRRSGGDSSDDAESFHGPRLTEMESGRSVNDVTPRTAGVTAPDREVVSGCRRISWWRIRLDDPWTSGANRKTEVAAACCSADFRFPLEASRRRWIEQLCDRRLSVDVRRFLSRLCGIVGG